MAKYVYKKPKKRPRPTRVEILETLKVLFEEYEFDFGDTNVTTEDILKFINKLEEQIKKDLARDAREVKNNRRKKYKEFTNELMTVLYPDPQTAHEILADLHKVEGCEDITVQQLVARLNDMARAGIVEKSKVRSPTEPNKTVFVNAYTLIE